jgi:glycerol-3-phosphate cytidylyltransferase-like family protein
MRVLIVSGHALFAQGMAEWLRQQLDVDIVGLEKDMDKATRSIEQMEPDVILLEMDQDARDPSSALMRFLRNGLDTQIIGVNLQDNCISLYYRGHWVMQKVGDLLQVIQEAGKEACSPCSAKEVDEEKTRDV